VADDLSAPLGRDRKDKPEKRASIVPTLFAGVLGLFLAIFLVWAAVFDDPFGGEPMVVMATDPNPTAAKKPQEPAAKAAKAEPAPKPAAVPAETKQAGDAGSSGMQTVTIINGASGNRQDVLVPSQDQGLAQVDPKLLEDTRHGQIPRIAVDGSRAFVAYARPVAATAANANMPRIAIVIAGLGVGASTTAEALTKLPAPVSFAFAPYGTDLTRLASRARGEGHELLLQLPMEPFDYPDNDPGPQTLLISLAPEQNVDRMHWLMSRFQGYVGVTNYMGSHFTASDAAIAPVLREVAKRGLMYLDDATSPRSLAGQIAGASGLPYVKANVVLDAVPTANEIDGALARLEKTASDAGIAVGVASALPISITRIAAWAKKAESRGFLLVPISAAASKPKPS